MAVDDLHGWVVEIDWHTPSLDTLAARYQYPEFSIHRRDGKYYLTSIEFDSIDDKSDVNKRAMRILMRVNGANRIQDPSYHPAAVRGAVMAPPKEGRPRQQFIGLVGIPSESAVGIPTVSGGVQTPPATVGTVLRRVAAAEDDERIDLVLRLIQSTNLDFIEMYKVFEVIRDAVGGDQNLVARGWTMKSQLRRFTRTANAEERHAPGSYARPPNPMTLSEGQAFVAKLADDWLRDERGV